MVGEVVIEEMSREELIKLVRQLQAKVAQDSKAMTELQRMVLRPGDYGRIVITK